ncbi:hypothetical protein [Nocardia sp. CA-120079]
MPTDRCEEIIDHDPPPPDEEPEDAGDADAAEELKAKFGDK